MHIESLWSFSSGLESCGVLLKFGLFPIKEIKEKTRQLNSNVCRA